MAEEVDNEVPETEVLDSVGKPSGPAPDAAAEDGQPEKVEPQRRMSVRESIQDAIRKASRPSEDKNTKPPAQGAAAPGQKAGEQKSTPSQGVTTGPPDSWKSKDRSTLWSGLPPAVQAAITAREAEMQKGVDQLKARHQELDSAIAPYRENIRRFGFTESQAVDQLFKWQMALAGPQKIEAFVALLRSHGVDPATFAAAITGGAAPQPNQSQSIQIPPQLLQEIDGIKNELGQYKAQIAEQTKSAAGQTVTSWAKDKPHYDKVKLLMGRLIQSGAVEPSEGDPFALDAAYNMAVYAHPEARDAVTAEQREKDAAARKATAEQARKAGSSMRTGAPVPPAANGAAKVDQRNETVRDSIKRALAELRQ